MGTLNKCCATFQCRKMSKTDQVMLLTMLKLVMGSSKFMSSPVTMKSTPMINLGFLWDLSLPCDFVVLFSYLKHYMMTVGYLLN
jgi:hypothetical protein